MELFDLGKLRLTDDQGGWLVSVYLIVWKLLLWVVQVVLFRKIRQSVMGPFTV